MSRFDDLIEQQRDIIEAAKELLNDMLRTKADIDARIHDLEHQVQWRRDGEAP